MKVDVKPDMRKLGPVDFRDTNRINSLQLKVHASAEISVLAIVLLQKALNTQNYVSDTKRRYILWDVNTAVSCSVSTV